MGIVAGSIIGLIQGIIGGEMVFGLLLGFLLGLGAMVGDALGSFSKRRLGLESGSPAPVLDQVGFVIFAFLFACLVTSLELGMLMILLVLTPAIHLITNVVAFKIGIKDVWY